MMYNGHVYLGCVCVFIERKSVEGQRGQGEREKHTAHNFQREALLDIISQQLQLSNKAQKSILKWKSRHKDFSE